MDKVEPTRNMANVMLRGMGRVARCGFMRTLWGVYRRHCEQVEVKMGLMMGQQQPWSL